MAPGSLDRGAAAPDSSSRSVPGRFRVVLAAAGAALLLSGGAAHAQYRGELSTIVMDAGTGNVLQQSNTDLQRFPASLTKLMTLYLTFDALRQNRISLDQAVPVSAHAASMEPSKLDLQPGSYLTVEQAVLGLVTKSANDAACALGEMLAGGDETAFAQMMTQKARSLGMSSTTFRNASGLPDAEQVSTARDFATLTRPLINDFPEDYPYFSVPAFMFHGREVPNHDPMLRMYPGADGLKTGYTVDAGLNLVTSAVRGNVRLIGVVLGARTSPQRVTVMASLLDGGFSSEGVPVDLHPNRDRAAGMLLAADTAPVAVDPGTGWHRRGRGRPALRLALVRAVLPASTHSRFGRVRIVGARVHLAGAVAASSHHNHYRGRAQKG